MRSAAIAALILVALAGSARADDAAAAFRAASEKLAAGDVAGAQAAFEAAAAIDPTGPWADDALAEAASAAERRGDLANARRLWQRVLDEFPSSRASRRARVRVQAIDTEIGAGGQWLAVAEQHEAILREATGVGDPTDEIAQLSALVDAHPDYPRAAEARLWIADTWMRQGREDRAAVAYRAAADAARDDDSRWRADKGLGDALLASDDLDGAEATYRDLLGKGSDLDDRVLAGSLDEVARNRTRRHLALACWIVLGVAGVLALAHLALAAGSVRAAMRALLRPPVELAYFVPVAALLFAVAFTGNWLIARAVRRVLLGGLAVTWLSGASLAAARGRLRAPTAIGHALLAALCVAAIAYLSVIDDRLIDLIRETWLHGPEK